MGLEVFTRVIRKRDFIRQLKNALLIEQDYELASLYDAMENKDEKEIARSKARLLEIHNELESFENKVMVFK